MDWKLRGVSRYRPRVLTLAVLLVIAAVLVLANLSDEYRQCRSPSKPSSFDSRFDAGDGPASASIGGTGGLSYGWPLLWHQYVIGQGYAWVVGGWRYSEGRLAANVVMWLIMLAAPAAACEWMLRRYRPRFRWNLRAMLAVVSLVAAFFGWFVWARDRADAEDSLIHAIEGEGGQVWVERWGPTWLDLVGADRYRRRIVAARVRFKSSGAKGNKRSGHEVLRNLSQLSNFKFLFLEGRSLNRHVAGALGDCRQLRMLSIESEEMLPGTIDALAESLPEMPQLRVLSISVELENNDSDGDELADSGNDEDARLANDSRMLHRCLAAVGKATQVEYLRLSQMTVESQSLACLGGLSNLKLLSLNNFYRELDEPNSPPLLSQLPVLERLEAVDVDSDKYYSGDGALCDRDLRYFARLPRLKSLSLVHTDVTGAGLAELAPLTSIEELSLCGKVISSAGLGSLPAFRNLKRLHIDVGYSQPTMPNAAVHMIPYADPGQPDASMHALQALRQTHPGIAIDGNWQALFWWERQWVPSDYDTADRSLTSMVRDVVRQWKQAGRPP